MVSARKGGQAHLCGDRAKAGAPAGAGVEMRIKAINPNTAESMMATIAAARAAARDRVVGSADLMAGGSR